MHAPVNAVARPAVDADDVDDVELAAPRRRRHALPEWPEQSEESEDSDELEDELRRETIEQIMRTLEVEDEPQSENEAALAELHNCSHSQFRREQEERDCDDI